MNFSYKFVNSLSFPVFSPVFVAGYSLSTLGKFFFALTSCFVSVKAYRNFCFKSAKFAHQQKVSVFKQQWLISYCHCQVVCKIIKQVTQSHIAQVLAATCGWRFPLCQFL